MVFNLLQLVSDVRTRWSVLIWSHSFPGLRFNFFCYRTRRVPLSGKLVYVWEYDRGLRLASCPRYPLDWAGSPGMGYRPQSISIDQHPQTSISTICFRWAMNDSGWRESRAFRLAFRTGLRVSVTQQCSQTTRFQCIVFGLCTFETEVIR